MTEPKTHPPLLGKRVIVTRPADQSASLKSKLLHLGASVLEIPVTQIIPVYDFGELDRVIKTVSEIDWLVFASPNGAFHFLERVKQLGKLAQLRAKIAVVGPSTGARLNEFGLKPEFVPTKYTAERFAEEFIAKVPNLAGAKIVWARGNVGGKVIYDELQKVGANVSMIQVYQNILPTNRDEIAKPLKELRGNNLADAILFASSQSVKNFSSLFLIDIPKEQMAHIRIISIGPETSRTCQEYLGRVDSEASVHTMDGLVSCLVNCSDDSSYITEYGIGNHSCWVPE